MGFWTLNRSCSYQTDVIHARMVYLPLFTYAKYYYSYQNQNQNQPLIQEYIPDMYPMGHDSSISFISTSRTFMDHMKHDWNVWKNTLHSQVVVSDFAVDNGIFVEMFVARIKDIKVAKDRIVCQAGCLQVLANAAVFWGLRKRKRLGWYSRDVAIYINDTLFVSWGKKAYPGCQRPSGLLVVGISQPKPLLYLPLGNSHPNVFK